jgi:RNA polymerase sigma-70 factor (ECF subfamily)
MAPQSPLSPERERQLVRQLQSGDRGALGELLGAYHRRVYHQCLRMLSNPDDAAEVTQDALTKAIQHVDGFKGDSRFGTWLFRIAMNVSISHLRRRKVRQAASLDKQASADTGSDQAADLKALLSQRREPQPDQSVEQREQVELLMAALDRLEANLKGVILLRDLQGMDYQQIADVMGVPVGTIKSRLFRARLALREAMVQQDQAAGEVRDD